MEEHWIARYAGRNQEGKEESWERQTASSCRSRPLRRSRAGRHGTQLHEDTNVVVQAFAQEA